MSCVTTTEVVPIVEPSRSIRSSMVLDVSGSSPDVGSSYRMYLGSMAMARASATRFCWPPDSSAGFLAPASGELDEGQALVGAGAHLVAGQVGKGAEGKLDVLAGRHRVEQGAALEQHAELAAHLAELRVGQLRQRRAVDDHAPRVGREQPDEVAPSGRSCPSLSAR